MFPNVPPSRLTQAMEKTYIYRRKRSCLSHIVTKDESSHIIWSNINSVFLNSHNPIINCFIFSFFGLDMVLWKCMEMCKIFRKTLISWFNRYDTRQFSIPNEYSVLFSENKPESYTYYNKTTNIEIFLSNLLQMSKIFITIFFLAKLRYLAKSNQQKHIISIINRRNNIPQIEPFLNRDIIWGAIYGCESQNIDQGRSYYNKNINIEDCYFVRSSVYSLDGGVIYVKGASYTMKINSSMFYNCASVLRGGAIFFQSTNSHLKMICANKCSCGNPSSCHFAYFKITQANQVEYLSVSYCSHITTGNYAFRLETGNTGVENTNSSMNSVIQGSGIGVYLPTSFTCSHCTFSNNNASGNICILLYLSTGTISISSANIVHNNSPVDGVVYVTGGGTPKMMYCIFQNNQNYLFCVLAGSLDISHSLIDHSSLSFSTSITIITETNNTFGTTEPYQILFFNSHYCNADITFPVRTPDLTLIESMTFQNTLEATRINTPKESPMNTYKETLHDTLINTQQETPMNTYKETQHESPINTQLETPNETPMNTYKETQHESPINTQLETPNETPMNTYKETLHDTLINTQQKTLQETPIISKEETPINTQQNTPNETPKNSPKETLFKTPEETQMNNITSFVSIRVVLISLSIVILIISLIYAIGLLLISQESSNSSGSNSDEFISAPIEETKI